MKRLVLAATLLVLTALVARAQSAPGPGGSPGTPGGTPPEQSVPADGGLVLLALAGGAYAARRLSQPR